MPKKGYKQTVEHKKKVNEKRKLRILRKIIIKCSFCGKEKKIFPCRKKIKNYCNSSCRAKNNPSKNFTKGHIGAGKIKNIDGKRKHSGGYISMYSPLHPNKNIRNEVLQHRLVVEKMLGRYLDTKEVIHHINGKRSDNRPENLYLFNLQKEHSSYESSKNKKVLISNIF